MECEIKWCKRKVKSLIYVNEIIGDGSWRVGICANCAQKLGLRQGDDLPPAHKVQSILGRRNKGDRTSM
jgi:hypothetical protein